MDVEQTLIEFAQNARSDNPARQMMRLSLLDWAGCAIAGQHEGVSQIVTAMALAEAGAGQASIVGQSQKVPMRAAALANGTLSHALDYDDTHFAHIGHPSVVVVPAATAVAEQTGSSGEDFLDAVLVGAEASIRIGQWLGRAHYQAGFHQTATAGAFGATLAAGRLLGLNANQMGHALGLVSANAAGLKSQFGTMGKPYQAGHAAASGVNGALLAARGFQSNPQGLSGPQGFGVTHAGNADARAFQGMAKHWMFETVSHKFHACCHGLHAMLEALAGLEKIENMGDIQELMVTTNPRWKAVCHQLNPETGLGTKFSYRHTAAMALAGLDTGGVDSFSDANANDPALVSLRDKVSVRFDETIAETATVVTLTLLNGRNFTAKHDLASGMPADFRQEKILGKVQKLVGKSTTEILWRALNPKLDLPAFLAALSTGVVDV